MAGQDFNDYHVGQISRSSFFRVPSAVGLFCIISSALDTDGDIKCCSLYPVTAVGRLCRLVARNP